MRYKSNITKNTLKIEINTTGHNYNLVIIF